MGSGPKKFKTKETDIPATTESRFWGLTVQSVVLDISKFRGSPKLESEEHEQDKSDFI